MWRNTDPQSRSRRGALTLVVASPFDRVIKLDTIALEIRTDKDATCFANFTNDGLTMGLYYCYSAGLPQSETVN